MKGYISQEEIVRISEKADIVEIVSRYVNLKKSGKNYRGLCPFHSEKTPSFFVNPEKQIFHCFGCGIGGDVFKFLMKIENITFPEAVEKVGKEVGIEINFQKKKVSNNEKDEIIKANEFATKKYLELIFSSQGKIAFEYLYNRNFDENSIKNFSLGYAPYEKNFLVKKVEAEGLNKEIFIKAGLISEDGEKDVFRNRIMFPIMNWNGDIIGFGGRVIEDNIMPKYLNTKENLIFNKSRSLYGLYWAKDSIKEKNYAIIVEGYFDVLKLYINNIKNVVAPMGTALTEGHLNILRRYTDRILLVFDSDSAGINASIRNLENILKNNFEVKLCPLPTGFDPDKFIDEFGKEPFLKMLNNSQNFIDFMINVESKSFDIESPRGKSLFVKEISKLVSLIPDEIERNEYIKYLSEKTNVEKEIVKKYIDETMDLEEKEVRNKLEKKDTKTNAEIYLLKILLNNQEYIEEVIKNKEKLTERIRKVVDVIEKLLRKNIKISISNLISSIDDEQLTNLISNLSIEENIPISNEKKRRVFEDCMRRVKEMALREKLKKMKREIATKGKEYSEKELEEIQTILYQLKSGR